VQRYLARSLQHHRSPTRTTRAVPRKRANAKIAALSPTSMYVSHQMAGVAVIQRRKRSVRPHLQNAMTACAPAKMGDAPRETHPDVLVLPLVQLATKSLNAMTSCAPAKTENAPKAISRIAPARVARQAINSPSAMIRRVARGIKTTNVRSVRQRDAHAR
jgi:hypothetical protein